ncbi:unnamed protein product [Rangifer tarandus platyrhynchus]|uniref:Uncharacterized protein n=1 Tax=Rangifer tarandus platyrhynchus TaxID=3082113 RepID=A0AC59ZNJ6_RANTA
MRLQVCGASLTHGLINEPDSGSDTDQGPALLIRTRRAAAWLNGEGEPNKVETPLEEEAVTSVLKRRTAVKWSSRESAPGPPWVTTPLHVEFSALLRVKRSSRESPPGPPWVTTPLHVELSALLRVKRSSWKSPPGPPWVTTPLHMELSALLRVKRSSRESSRLCL